MLKNLTRLKSFLKTWESDVKTCKSNWKGFFECHIEPDWLLIYRVNEDKEELELARTGSHSELF